MSVKKFYGKYRGTVLNILDPLNIGRIQAQVPAVSALLPTSWCLPCYPIAGRLSGASFIPQLGSAVWIEFEGGDPDKPIWTGCFYGLAAERPMDAAGGTPVTPNLVLQGQFLHSIVIHDLPPPAGGVVLKTVGGAQIAITDAGIVISNNQGASITLMGPQVAINGAALVVGPA
jgi:Type VI secretion system/phage-baseplate injector OB domain